MQVGGDRQSLLFSSRIKDLQGAEARLARVTQPFLGTQE